jgi:hypothetical protein
MPAPETLVALLIGAGALVAAVRLVLAFGRGPWGWALAAGSLASGALLYLTLFPPLLPIGGETLLVATAETPADLRPGPGERLVLLPEAPAIADGERVPDLATALRRHGQVQRLVIHGRGLPARDRDSAAGLPVSFTPMPLPKGLIRLDPPADTPVGAAFTLGGAAKGLEGGTAELLDPAGRRVDQRALSGEGSFTLGGIARAPGLALFILRLRGKDKRIVSDTPVPLRTLAAPAPLRALLIGAPSPEAKYLRRWAEDAGFALRSRLDAGAGVDLGGDGVRIDAGTLREVDVVIIEDQALAALGSAGRSVLAQAVAGGLGVVVRMTGPATPSTREGWRAIGLTVEGGADIAPVVLPPVAPDAEALAVRRGPGSEDVPQDVNTLDDPAPELARFTIRAGSDLVPVVRDADGALLAGWQQRGAGRTLLWSVPDSFALVLGGQPELYEQWWSAALSAVARAEGGFYPDVPALAEAGERMAICGIAADARVSAPDGVVTALAIDPAAGPRGCAAYWPKGAGVHTIRQPGREGEQSFGMMVLPSGSLKAIRERETGEATALWAASAEAAAVVPVPERRGAGWPWLLGWLVVSGALWWGERHQRARMTA